MSNDPELLRLADAPAGNDKKAKEELKELFSSKIPELPKSKQFASKEDRDHIRKLWPAGHEAGIKRLQHFLAKVKTYIQEEQIHSSHGQLQPTLSIFRVRCHLCS